MNGSVGTRQCIVSTGDDTTNLYTYRFLAQELLDTLSRIPDSVQILSTQISSTPIHIQAFDTPVAFDRFVTTVFKSVWWPRPNAMSWPLLGSPHVM